MSVQPPPSGKPTIVPARDSSAIAVGCQDAVAAGPKWA